MTILVNLVPILDGPVENVIASALSYTLKHDQQATTRPSTN